MLSLIIFVRRFKNNKLVNKQIKKATTSETEIYAVPSLKINAARTKGINKRKENLAAFSRLRPRNIPEDIVIPLREIPGKSASTWNSPITNAFFVLNLEVTFVNLVRRRIIPVNMKAIPRKRYEENIFSIISWKRKPNIAAGAVAIIKNVQRGFDFLSNFNKEKISFRVKIRTAIKEARCNVVKKNKFGLEIKFETSDRWPEDDTGRNSVAA